MSKFPSKKEGTNDKRDKERETEEYSQKAVAEVRARIMIAFRGQIPSFSQFPFFGAFAPPKVLRPDSCLLFPNHQNSLERRGCFYFHLRSGDEVCTLCDVSLEFTDASFEEFLLVVCQFAEGVDVLDAIWSEFDGKGEELE